MFHKHTNLLGTLVSLMLAGGILTGCSGTPVSAKNADPIDPNYQYAYREKGEAQLVVTRDRGWYKGGHTVDFLIDGELAAEMRMGDVAKFGLKAGHHIIAVSMNGTLVEREVTLNAGETVRRRIPVGAVLDVTPTTFE
ncbi:hypothetical protein [Pseudomonas sp. NPDC096950]|uniref:hypothetical protein n=1 Tax=Pseudomonas sp. NPDC096950 TaxID=3364485 RepID=UPI00383A97AB